MMNKILVNIGLPKTGTTFLAKKLSLYTRYSLSSVKEPNFFLKAAAFDTGDKILRQVLAPGRYTDGDVWYKKLYGNKDESNNDLTWVDMSTQYWLDMVQVVDNIKKSGYAAEYILIDREPMDQVTSYIAHLRRGYIPDIALKDIFINSEPFLRYITDMFTWPKRYPHIIRQCGIEDRTQIINFKELISDEPLPFIIDTDEVTQTGNNKIRDVPENAMSYSKYPQLSNMMFSSAVRKIGRVLPPSVRSEMLNWRKKLQNKILVKGKSKHYNEDYVELLARFSKYVK